ncbi:MAG TPA: alpha-1,4-glucan--maltose-1-phosphate maltosyltransferase [Burkholderiales bacterium]|nr:alpha-1,4-glucan--maltose-1-phosphate maltosyltransferase [Burkholderiales bacterium]
MAEMPPEGRVRAVIDAVRPSVDGGRFAVKRIAGDRVAVEADAFCDGHDTLRVLLRWRPESETSWREIDMEPLGNDLWRGEFALPSIGRYRYTVTAWVDEFLTWRNDFARRQDPADVRLAARTGAVLIEQAAERARGNDRRQLAEWAKQLAEAASSADFEAISTTALDEPLAQLARKYPDRRFAATWPLELPLVADRERARFSTWYELFPRSASPQPGRHGTFRDCEARLAYLSQLGFDVLYLPPIHPIGREKRKGRNNALVAASGDVGSPWAIGSSEGGHTAVHPDLGTLEDFRRLVSRANGYGIEIALDIAFQCAPDHPYVGEHPQWFRKRADGSVQYAENPPKKYEDIYPFHFETDDWRALWAELKHVIDFWIGEGVRIFRVDNPHTKSFAFWHWAIDEVKRAHPDVIFLAEAFTRPKVMHRLAKLGFTQSYTYFAWRNTKRELTEYFTELARGPGREYFRPNVWPNTPDILTEALQVGGRPAFMARLVLAATLAANYGLYGPAYELMEHLPREPGSEEYLHSEKYELRQWDLERADSLRDFVALVNRIRRDHPALHADWNLRFFATDNEQLLAYAKIDRARDSAIVTVVNLDPHHVQEGFVELDLPALGVDPATQFQMHDLLTDARYIWQGSRNYVRLDPARVPAHILRVRSRLHREQDFDYFL